MLVIIHFTYSEFSCGTTPSSSVFRRNVGVFNRVATAFAISALKVLLKIEPKNFILEEKFRICEHTYEQEKNT